MERAIVIGAALALAAGQVQAQDAATVEGLVAHIYDGYRPGGDPEKTNGTLPFDASLKALVKQVEDTNSEGVGFDPYCACQDYEITKVMVKAVTVTAKDATVVARFNNFGDATQVVYKLVMTPTGWAIHEMILPEAPSFRALLVEAAKP